MLILAVDRRQRKDTRRRRVMPPHHQEMNTSTVTAMSAGRASRTRRPRSIPLPVLAGLFLVLLGPRALAPAAAHADPARSAPAAAPPYDWLQFDGDPQHSGNNTQEATLAPATVAALAPLFRVTFTGLYTDTNIGAYPDSAPVYLS